MAVHYRTHASPPKRTPPTTAKTFDFAALIEGVTTTHSVRVVPLEGTPWFVAAAPQSPFPNYPDQGALAMIPGAGVAGQDAAAGQRPGAGSAAVDYPTP